MAFQARVKIKDIIVAQSNYEDSLQAAVAEAARRFRASGAPTNYEDPLIFEVYYKDTR